MPEVFFIAEAGVNHNGSPDIALQLVQAAAEAGADAVKFQTFEVDQLVSSAAQMLAYQKRGQAEGDQASLLRGLVLPAECYPDLLACCRDLEVEFMSTPFDMKSAEFLLKLGVQRLKIPSGEVTNIPFLRELARTGLPLILSTGMSTLEEVRDAVIAIQEEREPRGVSPLPRLTLLHCVSNYPTSLKAVNLRSMQTMAEHFGLPVGFSDHTEGALAALAAAALGASVIEKHLTLDRSMTGPDHQASMMPAEMKSLIEGIRKIEICLGSALKQPQPEELEARERIRRSLILTRAKEAGSKLGRSDLAILRPGTGIEPVRLEEVIGRTLCVAVQKGTPLLWSHLK